MPTPRGLTWFVVGVAGVAIAIAVLGVGSLRRHVAAPEDFPAIVSAVSAETVRPVAGRLIGGFRHAPLAPRAAGPGLSPAVRIKLARFETRAAASSSPKTRAEGAAAALLAGRVDQAIATLEALVRDHPEDAALQSDLAVAYLERAGRQGQFQDNVRALDAAARAVRLDPRRPEPLFNAALAAHRLSLAAEVRALRERLAAVDRSPWVADLDGAAGGDASSEPDLQPVREHIENELLPSWANAVLAGDEAAATRILGEAVDAARRLAGRGDGLPLDGVIAIQRAAGDRARRTALARAHRGYAAASRALARLELDRAAAEMSSAARDFRAGGSPYALWEPVYRAIRDRMAARIPAALNALADAFAASVPPRYLHLLGRVWWTRAVSHESAGHLDVARHEFERAIEAFSRAGERSLSGMMETMLAEALGSLGDFGAAWEHEAVALGGWQQTTAATRPDVILLNAGFLASDERFRDAALAFHNEVVGYLKQHPDPARAPEAYLHRADRRLALGDTPGAVADLARAEGAAGALQDADVRRRIVAEILAVRARAIGEPRAAVAAATGAVDYFRAAGHRLRTVLLLVERARAHERAGDLDAAEADLGDAIDEFERERGQLLSEEDRAISFQQGRAAFAEMIRVQAVARNRPERALALLERSHSGAGGIDVEAIRRRLPADAAVLMMAQLDDRLLLWLVTPDGLRHATRTVGRAAVAARVDAFRRAIADEADRSTLQARSAPLLELLSPGLLDQTNAPRLAIVADGDLFALPFAALVQPTGRYLVEDRAIEMASGLGAFVETRGRVRTASVLAIGDGHTPTPTLPRLRAADGEAAAVAAEYPAATTLPGTLASRSRVLAGLGGTDVFHFAGHSVANAEHPQYAHLLAAPDAADGRGAVFPADLYSLPLSSTSVVVLASCETAVGRPVLGEGSLSLAKPFLSRGVRFVVASLWPVDDGRAQALTVAFHRALRGTGDPVAALRTAQLKSIGSPDTADRAPKIWSAFSAYSGHSSRQPRKDS